MAGSEAPALRKLPGTATPIRLPLPRQLPTLLHCYSKALTPQRTRWLGHLGEYLRTGERRFLYAFGESRKVAKLIDARIDVNIDSFSTPSAFRRSLLPRSRVTLSRRLYSAVEHRRPGHRSSGRCRVTAWCFVRSAASRKRSWLRACVYGATGRCRLDRAEERPLGMRSRAGRRRRRCFGPGTFR